MKLLVAAVALSAGLIGCSSSHSAPPRAVGPPAGPSTASPVSTAPAASPSAMVAGDGGGNFCADARAIGLDQKINLNDGSSKADASLLPKLDALDAEAPAAIHSDFTLFVKIEHALLGGGTPDPLVLQQIDAPGTESRLAHVGRYLDDHCGTGAS